MCREPVVILVSAKADSRCSRSDRYVSTGADRPHEQIGQSNSSDPAPDGSHAPLSCGHDGGTVILALVDRPDKGSPDTDATVSDSKVKRSSGILKHLRSEESVADSRVSEAVIRQFPYSLRERIFDFERQRFPLATALHEIHKLPRLKVAPESSQLAQLVGAVVVPDVREACRRHARVSQRSTEQHSTRISAHVIRIWRYDRRRVPVPFIVGRRDRGDSHEC